MARVSIFDTTLRDGLKSPGTILSLEEKLRMARQLARLNVDVLDIGFPAASEEQFSAAERIIQEVKGPELCVLARATNLRDFDIAWNVLKHAPRGRLHTFVPVSRAYREHYLKKSLKETVEIAVKAIARAREYTDNVEFSLVDAFRADPEEVKAMVRAALKAGAAVVNLADTVGAATPSHVKSLLRFIGKQGESSGKGRLSIHCHNDLGLAVANSLAAIEGGAEQVHCTVNGIGERAGNAPLEEVLVALRAHGELFKKESGVKMEEIYPTCRLVRRLTGIGLQPHKPVVGSNVFVFEPVVPQLEDNEDKPPCEIIDPRELGADNVGDVLAAETGLEAFRNKLMELGYEFTEDQTCQYYEDFKDLAGKKGLVFDADLELLLGSRSPTMQVRYRLLYLNVTAGSISVPNAAVQLEVDGQILQDAGFGHGPVDAAFKTICKIVRRFPKLVRYEVRAVTGGTDAQGEVSLRLEEGGCLVSGRAVDTDIVLASARALVDGLNKLESLQGEPPISEFTDMESWLPRL